MKTSDAIQHSNVCPDCGKPVSRDLKGRGFVRHTERPDEHSPAREEDGLCHYGHGERD